jgi:hypothetical protein
MFGSPAEDAAARQVKIGESKRSTGSDAIAAMRPNRGRRWCRRGSVGDPLDSNVLAFTGSSSVDIGNKHIQLHVVPVERS